MEKKISTHRKIDIILYTVGILVGDYLVEE